MSNLIQAPVWKMELKTSAKFVAISLAEQANDDGYCWPGIKSIARRTCMGERTVQEALRYLEEIKLIEVIPRPGTSNAYQFNMEMIRQAELFAHEEKAKRKTPTPAKSAPPRNPHPRESRTGGVRNLRGRGAAPAPKPSINRNEPSLSHSQQPTPPETDKPGERDKFDPSLITAMAKGLESGRLVDQTAYAASLLGRCKPETAEALVAAARRHVESKAVAPAGEFPVRPDGTPDFLSMSNKQLLAADDRYQLKVSDSGIHSLTELQQRYRDAWFNRYSDETRTAREVRHDAR